MSPSTTFHFAGEYGLWVSEEPDGRIRVAWLGDDDEAGFLKVVSGERTLHELETPVATAHVARFERPPPGALRLEYGIRGAPAHVTVLHLDDRERRPAEVEDVDSLFVVGDVHGEYETLFRLLHNAELVDEEGRWSGGGRHIAFLGDLFDRGSDVTRTLWFLYRLEREAAEAGGGVHVVLGNHEVMVLTDDLRYVASKERMIAHFHAVDYDRMYDPRHSVLGRWLVSQPGLLRVDDLLLAHGGVSPAYSEYSVQAFDDSLAVFVAEDLFYHMGALFDPEDTTAALVTDPRQAARAVAERVIVMDSAAAARRIDFFFAENSVFWFRDYVGTDTLSDALDRVLERHGATAHVVAHTPVEPIQSRYGGRLVAVDLAEPATEMALFVRERGEGWTVLRYTTEGPPTPLPDGSSTRPDAR